MIKKIGSNKNKSFSMLSRALNKISKMVLGMESSKELNKTVDITFQRRDN